MLERVESMKALQEIAFTLWWDTDIPKGERWEQVEHWIKEAKAACGGIDSTVRYSRFLDGDRPGIEVRIWTRDRYKAIARQRLEYLERTGQGNSQEAEMLHEMLEVIDQQGSTLPELETEVDPNKERENMITIKRLATETGRNERTLRDRVLKARERGDLQQGIDWMYAGGAIWIDREKGLEVAKARIRLGRPRR